MTVYRFARPEEEDRILDLIDLVFSKTGHAHDFASLLPKVYGHPGFSAYHAVAEQDGRLVGTIAMLPTEVWMGDAKLLGGYIGSVAVHSRFRGQGHMKALMELLIETAKSRGYDFLALGGQRQRYGHWGFEECGMSFRCSVNRMNVRHALEDVDAAFTFVPPGGEHFGEMKALHDRLPFHCERSLPLFPEIVKSYNGEPLAILDREGRFSGYLIRMEQVIAELCLKDEAALPAAVKCLMRDEKRLVFQVPGCLPARARTFRAFAEDIEIGDKEMLLPLNWENLLRAGLRLRSQVEKTPGSRNPLPDGERIIEIEKEGAFRLKMEGGEASVIRADGAPDRQWTRRQAVDSLFSPVGAYLSDDPLLRAWLPLPWGLNAADTF